MPTLAGNRGRMQATDSTAVFGSRGAHPVLRAGFRQAGCAQGITNIIKATGIVDGQVGRPPRIDFAEFYMHFGNIAPLVDVLDFFTGCLFSSLGERKANQRAGTALRPWSDAPRASGLGAESEVACDALHRHREAGGSCADTACDASRLHA